jgi:hypothetical protein
MPQLFRLATYIFNLKVISQINIAVMLLALVVNIKKL